MYPSGKDDVYCRFLPAVSAELRLCDNRQHLPAGVMQPHHGLPAHGTHDGQPLHPYPVRFRYGSHPQHHSRHGTRYRRGLGQAGQGKKSEHAYHLPVLHDSGAGRHFTHSLAGIRLPMAGCVLLHDGNDTGCHPGGLPDHALPSLCRQTFSHQLPEIRQCICIQRPDDLYHLRVGVRKDPRLVCRCYDCTFHRTGNILRRSIPLPGIFRSVALLPAGHLPPAYHPHGNCPVPSADDFQHQLPVCKRVHRSRYADRQLAECCFGQLEYRRLPHRSHNCHCPRLTGRETEIPFRRRLPADRCIGLVHVLRGTECRTL